VSRGYYADNGPPTTLSGSGKDLSLSYQQFVALDDVQFVNGNQLGSRALFQVHWLGWLLGSKACGCFIQLQAGGEQLGLRRWDHKVLRHAQHFIQGRCR
jgi:hypothetical protein